MIAEHKLHPKYKNLSVDSRKLRDLACELVLEKIGPFDPNDIRPLHIQAIYDQLAHRPATSNRRLDDMSALFAWGRRRGYCDVNPCTKIDLFCSFSLFARAKQGNI